MTRQSLAKMILRSLCANTPEEEVQALENYRCTRVEDLEFSDVSGQLLDLVNQFYIRTNLSGPPSIQALLTQASLDVNPTLELYINEIQKERFQFGASYRSLLSWYIEDLLSGSIQILLADTSSVLKEGRKTRIGANNVVQKGVEDALDYIIVEATKLKSKLAPHQRPWNLQMAGDEMMEDFVEKARNPTLAYGMSTNISTIDDNTGGAQAKELWVIAGGTGHGKSVFVLNWARHLALQGFNVMFYSLEMDKKKVSRILYCSHSCDHKFGRPALSYSDIKFGRLSSEDADFYVNQVIRDLKSAPGQVQIFNPIGKRTTIDDIQQQAEVVNRERPLDMIIIDYLAILSAPRGMKNLSRTDRIGENLLRAKQLCSEFDNGYGLTVVTPHQVNRQGMKKAATETAGIFDLMDIADSSECERTADALFTIYQDNPLRQKQEAIMCNLKMRDSATLDPFNVYFPAHHRFVGELAQMDDAQLTSLLVV